MSDEPVDDGVAIVEAERVLTSDEWDVGMIDEAIEVALELVAGRFPGDRGAFVEKW